MMLFCPNQECPHRKKTGKPAEFVEGTTTCSDCGTLLSPESPGIEQEKEFTFTDFHKRILFTLGMVILYRLIAVVPVAGLDFKAFENFLEINPVVFVGFLKMFPPLSVVALGVMPYMTAYMLVEIFALFTPPLKSWRSAGNTGRKKLKITALILTILISLMQGYGTAKGFELMGSFRVVIDPGFGFRIMTALTLTAGAFLTLWIAELITKRGIGHGISILLITGMLARGVPYYIPKLKAFYKESSLLCFVFMLLLIVALFAVVIFIERSYREIEVRLQDGQQVAMPLKLTTAGIVPPMWASSLIMIPATVASFIAVPWVQSIANQLSPGSIIYVSLYAISLFLFYYFFTSLFYNPKKINSFLNKRHASIEVPNNKKVERYLDKILEPMALLGFVYLCLIISLPKILIKFFSVTVFIGGVGLITAIAIMIDVYEDCKARRVSEKLVKISEFHDILKAGFVKNILGTNGIQCYLRGYYHRALFYFFGPYIEVSALVPADKVDDANEVIRKYMNEEYH